MRNLHRNIGSIIILGIFTVMSTSTISTCLYMELPASDCKPVDPITRQFEITVNAIDFDPGVGIPNADVAVSISYDNAVTTDNKCARKSDNVKNIQLSTNAQGTATFTTTPFTMDNTLDRVLMYVSVSKPGFELKTRPVGFSYNSPSANTLTIILFEEGSL